jgi:hypothetical protein
VAGKGELARDLRAGLEEMPMEPASSSEAEEVSQDQEAAVHPLDELYFGKPVRIHVREFACVFSIIFLAIAAYGLIKNSSVANAGALLVASLILLAFGYLAPGVLRPVWSGWMAFAEALGKFMSTLIVSIAWTIVLVPVALLLRIIGKKVMDCSSYEPGVESYWEERDQKLHDFKLLERQF